MTISVSPADPISPLARIVIVTYNSADYANRCLDCLLAQTEPRFEVVIVDNGSVDVDQILVPCDPRFTLIRTGRNLGFAAANNLGARGAQAPWLITLNPDAFPLPDWLARLLTAARQYPDIAMFGSTQLFAHDPSMIDGEGDRYSIFGVAWRANYRKRRGPPYYSGEVFSPCAAAAMYRRDLFESVQGFDESYFCYYEDVDLGFRLRLVGGNAWQVGDAIVHHVSSGISREYGDFMRYHCYRNLIWTMAKNIPFPSVIVVTILNILAFSYLFAFRWKAVRMRTAARGFRDGLKGMRAALDQRKSIQGSRRVSQFAILRAMTWNPIQIKLRR